MPRAAIRAKSDGLSISDIGPFSQEERVLNVNAEISHRILDLAVAEQDLEALALSAFQQLRETHRVMLPNSSAKSIATRGDGVRLR